tara:strand:- start:670 stop:1578 length:909 start_codon:yes stop_codon:yes gene_type:complete
MIRQVTSSLKQVYNENIYVGGFMSRVAHGSDVYQYDSQIIEENMPSPAPSLNGCLTIRRRYRTKEPILKPSKWALFHELHDMYRIMQQLKNQHLYQEFILSVLKEITNRYQNHNQTPHLILQYISKPSISKAIQRTPTIPIHPRSYYFNPLQIVIGTLVARKIILPEANAYYKPHIIRAKLTEKPTISDQEQHSPQFHPTGSIISYMRRKEYERHYKLDPDHWYKYWPKNRHNYIKQSVQRFMYTISENEHWPLSTEYYQKQATNTWTLAPPPDNTTLVEYELKQREKIADAVYKEFFQLTH